MDRKEKLYEGVSVSDRSREGFQGTKAGKRTTKAEAKAEHGCEQLEGRCWPQLMSGALPAERALGEQTRKQFGSLRYRKP